MNKRNSCVSAWFLSLAACSQELTGSAAAGRDGAPFDASADGSHRDAASSMDSQASVDGSSSTRDAATDQGPADLGVAANVASEAGTEELCPGQGHEAASRPLPNVWAENQCIVRWSENDNSTMRAHYFQPGNRLYAKRHGVDGSSSFVNARLELPARRMDGRCRWLSNS